MKIRPRVPALVDRGGRWVVTLLSGLLLTGGLPSSALGAEGRAVDLVRRRAVPFTQVEIRDSFWSPRRATNRLASIPVNLENLEKSGNLGNLRLAGEGRTEGFQGPVFMDSDVYKALEAAAYSLATDPDPDLDRRLDEIIGVLARAQRPDGYLNSYFTVKEPGKRWTNLRDQHELYCAGHLFEAAVAHFQATGKRNFLNVATKLADHIDSVFGPPPKRLGYPGHPEIELALEKLAKVTQEPRYARLALFFVENRGRKFFAEEHHTPLADYDGTYWQDDVPITEHRNIKGHAVRAAYLLSGVTDVVADTGNPALLRMIDRVWRNTTERNMYVTGGIGPSASNEGFTEDYDLPNQTAYQETCASVALAQWNHRLALLHGDAKFADVFERSLYNGVLAGVSQDGTRFFYVNPLASTGHHHRSPWFGCACCPPNVARTLASLGGYAYAQTDDALWVNLFIQGSVSVTLGGQAVKLAVETDYPWDGKVVLKPQLTASAKFSLWLRVPGWSEGARLVVNGQEVSAPRQERGYVEVERTWKAGDVVEWTLPMPVQRVAANPRVEENRGRIALQRGPLVYCVEAADHGEALGDAYLPVTASLHAEKVAGLLGGVVALKGSLEIAAEQSWKRRLYQASPAPRTVAMTAIPYYAWDNRAAGPMQVWLPVTPPARTPAGPEADAKVALSFTSGNCTPDGIHDGKEPKSSHQHPGALCHWWPHKGGREWVEYRWTQPVSVAGSKVYWFDDTGVGECRAPQAWHLEYFVDGNWQSVKTGATYGVALDGWQEVTFDPVTTTALRLHVDQQSRWAAGIHEWKIIESEE